LPCWFNLTRPAVLDAEHRTTIGYESFFFSDSTSKARFDSDITSYCGVLTDPVTKQRFRPDHINPKMVYNQQVYFFATQANLQKFEGMPDMYALPHFEMLPKDSTQVQEQGT